MVEFRKCIYLDKHAGNHRRIAAFGRRAGPPYHIQQRKLRKQGRKAEPRGPTSLQRSAMRVDLTAKTDSNLWNAYFVALDRAFISSIGTSNWHKPLPSRFARREGAVIIAVPKY